MKTITFYSYKGGVGRTLLLANFAEYLAYCDKRVVIVDFDLEAPGIHLKFGLDPDSIRNSGLVNFINTAIKDINSIISLGPYLHSIPTQPNKQYYKNINIVPAGNAPSKEYADEYSKIPWYDLYYGFKSVHHGAYSEKDQQNSKNISGFRIFLLLQVLIENINPPIDYLLIDSRTGITDIGGTAITVLPDTLVCLFNNNLENIAGLQTVITSSKNTILRIKKLKINFIPVLTRIPEDSQIDIESLIHTINEKLWANDKIKKEELHIIRSEPDLEFVEELRFSSDKSLRENLILRDYLNVFSAIEPKIPKERELIELLNLIPSREESKHEEPEFSNTISIKDNIKEKSRRLKSIQPRFVFYNGGKEVPNSQKNQFSIFIDAVIKNMAMNLYDKYEYENIERDINWDLLGFQISEGFFDFCAEPYYLTRTRSHFLDIVQFGWLRTFTCFISRNSELYKNNVFGIKNFMNVDQSSFRNNFFELFKKSNVDFHIGVLGDHAAAIEVYRDLDFFPHNRIEYSRNENSLWDWLISIENAINNKLIICDHAVAKYLHRLENDWPGKQEYKGQFLSSTDALTFHFREPIPIGFVYPIEDIEWRKQISKAITDSFLDDSYGFSWEEVSKQLKAYHLELFGADRLLRQLIWDLNFKEADSIYKKLGKSINMKL